MKLLWLFFVLPAVLSEAGFGNSYMKNSRLCHQWSCINTKLGLPDSLPIRSVTEETFRRVLPRGPWQDVLSQVLDTCYGNRTRRYTNTCPGQALLHCIVDQMSENCPAENLRVNDACSQVESLAGFKHMFSRSRYDNLKENLPKERRPEWFMRHYFEQKCCDMPVMFNMTVLQECGFSSFMTYYTHEPKYDNYKGTVIPTPAPVTAAQGKADTVKILLSSDLSKPMSGSQKVFFGDSVNTDPLDCCDMTEFIQPAWRSECGFHLTWKGHERLVIANNTAVPTTEAPVTTSTARTDTPKDLMLLPQSCAEETCVFRKLGVISETGNINTLAFMQTLDNFTASHPIWKKAAARVVTKCLGRQVRDYEGECEINKVLACTLDLLTENCPYRKKSEDPCKHKQRKSGCQISSSKYRPKNRREVCLLPQLIRQDYLNECGLASLYRVQHVVVAEPKPRPDGWAATNYLCQIETPPTTCLMTKMGILNRYKFMDYFEMKHKIRQFTSQPEWSALQDIYLSAFINIPMYGQHCSSPKKLLNIVDAILMTCPVSKRVDSPQCTKIFKDMTETTPVDHQNVTKQKLDEIRKHYHHIFLPNRPLTTNFDRVIRKKYPKVVKKPIYNYGVLDSRDSPKVKVINIKPVVLTSPTKPLVLAPVYLRDRNLQLATPFHNDGVFRSNPYWLHERIAKAHFTTPVPDDGTIYSVPSTTYPPPTTSRVSPIFTTPSDLVYLPKAHFTTPVPDDGTIYSVPSTTYPPPTTSRVSPIFTTPSDLVHLPKAHFTTPVPDDGTIYSVPSTTYPPSTTSRSSPIFPTPSDLVYSPLRMIKPE